LQIIRPSKRALLQRGREHRIASRTVEELGIGSEFDVDGPRRVANRILTIGAQPQSATIAGRHLEPANRRRQADSLRFDDSGLRKLVHRLPIRQSFASPLEKPVAIVGCRSPGTDQLREALRGELGRGLLRDKRRRRLLCDRRRSGRRRRSDRPRSRRWRDCLCRSGRSGRRRRGDRRRSRRGRRRLCDRRRRRHRRRRRRRGDGRRSRRGRRRLCDRRRRRRRRRLRRRSDRRRSRRGRRRFCDRRRRGRGGKLGLQFVRPFRIRLHAHEPRAG